MNRLPVFWVQRPDEDDPDDGERSITFRVTEDWLAVDADQLILPISLLERNGEPVGDGGKPGLLKQYGGEGLLNDLLLDAEQDVEPGATFVIQYDESIGFHAYGVDLDDS